MTSGTAYGVVLNDRDERDALDAAFHAPRYDRPRRAPVFYIKPRGCFAPDDAPIPMPPDLAAVTIAAIGPLFGDDAMPTDCRLALDVSEPHAGYCRPAIRERRRDGFLRLGGFGAPLADPGLPITTRISGAVAHQRPLARLVPPISRLIADIAGRPRHHGTAPFPRSRFVQEAEGWKHNGIHARLERSRS